MTKQDNSSFERINNVLRTVDGFNYDFALYKHRKQGKGYVIEKYIENYISYLARVTSEEDNHLENMSEISLFNTEGKFGYLLFDETIIISDL